MNIKIKNLEDEKIKALEQIKLVEEQATEIINNAMDKIEMYQKNEEFCKSIVRWFKEKNKKLDKS